MKAQKAQGGKGRISPRQIKIIHTIKGKLGMDDDAYRALLAQYKVESSKDLSWFMAESLIEEMNRKAGSTPLTDRAGALPERSRRQSYADLDGRPGMCNGKQARMMEGMWMEVSWAETPEAKLEAQWKFLKRITGVDHFRFLRAFQVPKMVRALKEMKQKAGKFNQEGCNE